MTAGQSSRRRGNHLLTGPLTLLIVTLLLGACGSRPSETPAAPDEQHAAGSALPFGFRVPDGAAQAGPMLPCGFDPAFDVSTCVHGTVYLAVDLHHPEAALNAFLAQGYRLGYHGGVRCATFRTLASCAGELHQGPNLAPTTPSTVVLRTKPIIVPLPRPPGRAVNLTLQYGVGSQQDVAMMTAQFANQRPTNDCENLPACSRAAPPFTVAAPHVPGLARPGDQLEAALQSDVKVLPGSTVVMHVVDARDVSPTYVTLMKAPHDLDATVAAYRRAISGGKWAGTMHDDGEQAVGDGWRLRSWSFSGSDGGPTTTFGTLRNGSTIYLALRVTPSS